MRRPTDGIVAPAVRTTAAPQVCGRGRTSSVSEVHTARAKHARSYLACSSGALMTRYRSKSALFFAKHGARPQDTAL